MPAGYSGTPLLKKLGVKPEQSALLVNVPPSVRELAAFQDWRAVKRVKTHRGISGGPYDYVHVFTANAGDLEAAAAKLKTVVQQAGMIWISWPKKSSGVPSTVTEDTIREYALPIGLVDVKVCAVDEVWSGLKLMIRKAERT